MPIAMYYVSDTEGISGHSQALDLTPEISIPSAPGCLVRDRENIFKKILSMVFFMVLPIIMKVRL